MTKNSCKCCIAETDNQCFQKRERIGWRVVDFADKVNIDNTIHLMVLYPVYRFGVHVNEMTLSYEKLLFLQYNLHN